MREKVEIIELRKTTLRLVERARNILENVGVNYPNNITVKTDSVDIKSSHLVEVAEALYKAEIMCIKPGM